MEDMKVLETLREKVLTELDPVATKASPTPNDISVAKEAVCLLKEIEEVMTKHDENEERKMAVSEGRGHYMHHSSYGGHDPYMHDGYYLAPGRMYSYGDERTMDHYSTERGRSSITGRYVSRDGHNYGRSYEQHRDMGRSGHSIDDRIIDTLEHMMDDEDSNYARNKINAVIRVVDSMRGE